MTIASLSKEDKAMDLMAGYSSLIVWMA